MNGHTLDVVLVEDNSADVFLIDRALQEAGLDFRLRTFKDGEEALNFLGDMRNASTPDVFLIDWNLPRVPGKAVLQAIGNIGDFGKTTRIVLTSSDSPADQSEVEQLGAVFFSKPRSLDEFIQIGQKIRTLLGLP